VTDPETMVVIGQRQCEQYALTGRLLPRIWLLLSCCFHSKNLPLST